MALLPSGNLVTEAGFRSRLERFRRPRQVQEADEANVRLTRAPAVDSVTHSFYVTGPT